MLKNLISRFTQSTDTRGKRIVQQIAYGAGLKVVNAAVGIVIIPIYLALLTEVAFGIWLTVSAVVNWFNIFDLGLGNGLRNKLAEAKADSDHDLARTYVSTTYFCIGAMSLVLLGAFFLADQFVNWGDVFAAPAAYHEEVGAMTRILVVLFFPQFVLQLIKMVATADQRPAWANAINTAVNVLQLAAVFMLLQWGQSDLSVLAWTLGGINVAVLLFSSVGLYAKKYRRYRPSFRWVRLEHARDLVSLGLVFFVLQGAALVVFMTDNLIISRVLGPEEVPAYNIAYRYFNFVLVFFGLVTTPFWSAFTEAFAKRDMAWIRKMMKRLFRLWALISVLCVGMLLAAPWVYHLWIGEVVTVPFVLNAFMALWAITSAGLGIFGTFLSGLGKLRLTLFHAAFVMVVNIPLSIWLAGFPGLGSAGVILATLIGSLLRLLFQPLQSYKLMQGTARGIWNR